MTGSRAGLSLTRARGQDINGNDQDNVNDTGSDFLGKRPMTTFWLFMLGWTVVSVVLIIGFGQLIRRMLGRTRG